MNLTSELEEVSMKFPNSILFYVTTLTMTLGLGSSAQAQTPSNTISTARWSLDINSGIHDDTPYPINDCSSCKAVSNYGGLNASFDVNYQVDHLALGLLVESQAKIYLDQPSFVEPSCYYRL